MGWTGFCLVRFTDNKVHKIAHIDLVRHLDKRKFSPASVRDIPDQNVEVKWQQSVCGSDLILDGYYEAEMLALGGEYFPIIRLKLEALNILLLNLT